MNRKNKKFGLFLVLLLTITWPALADRDEAEAAKAKELERIESDLESYKEKVDAEFERQIGEGTVRETNINNKIETELLSFDAYQKIEAEAEEQLIELREKMGTVEGQLVALSISIDSARQQIDLARMQIADKSAKRKALIEEKEELVAEKDVQKNAIVKLLVVLQKQSLFSNSEDVMKNTLRILLSDESFSKNAWKKQQTIAMEKISRQLYHELEESERELDDLSRAIENETAELNIIYEKKKNEEANLQSQIKAQRKLQDDIRSDESEYERLLAESKRQMEASVQIIAELQNKKELLNNKVAILEARWEEEKDRIREENFELSDEDFEALFATSNGTFSWPVSPSRGISAYYLDPSYEGVFKVKHYAIDIPVPQGTEIKSPALGYVYKVQDNGMGYSSIILAHRGNVMTVFGHISEFLVEEGDLVQEGEVVALSGGTPGTKGAGWMTTGAHLHFEVFENGIHKNPLDYLPVNELPLEYIPNEYLK